MKMTRRILSWVLAIALVVTCGITGLVLPVAAEEVTNLFVNGDFEQGAAVSWASSTLIQESVGKDGGWGYYHNRTQTDEWSATGQVRYKGGALWGKLEAGYTYILSFDYKTSGDTIPQIFLDVVPADTLAGTLEPGSSNGEWKTVTYTFVPKADLKPNANWEFSFRSRGGAGELWYDNFSLVKAPASVELASETVKANVGETFNLDATFVNASAADCTWKSENEAVATVENGVVTTKALGEATISATIGDVTKSVVVSVVKDKTQEWANLSNAYYDAGANKGQKVDLKTDAATGLEYFSVQDSNSVATPKFGKFNRGEWIGYSFLFRVTDAANNPGAVRAGFQVQGSVTDGYTQPEFYARSTAAGGDWVRHTYYARVRSDGAYPYLVFITLAKPDNAAATYSYDIADVSVFRPEAGELNFAGYNADFDTDNFIPSTVGSTSQGGLLTKDIEITTDPTDPTNKVLHVKAGAAGSGGDYWSIVGTTNYNDSTNARTQYTFASSKMYRLSFRVYSASNVTVDSYGGGLFKGTVGSAAKSGQWRQFTTYMYTDSSFNSTYAFHARIYGEAYIDDLEFHEVVDATGLKINGNAEMTIGEKQTLVAEAIPKRAYAGTLTWALAEGATGLSLSGATLTATAVTGVEVKGGTVTVSSTLTDAEGNPIATSLDVKVNYPEEHFVNGTMDTGSLSGITFKGAGVYAEAGDWEAGVDGVGINGSKGLAMYATGANYFKGQSYKLKPNSVYVFQVYARSNGVNADLELSFVSGNNNSGNKVTSSYGSGTRTDTVDGEWVRYAMYFKTGETTTYWDSNWNLFLNVRGLPSNVPEGQTPAIFVDNISLQLISEGDNHFTGSDKPLDFEDAADEYFRPTTWAGQSIAQGEGLNGSNALKVTNETKAVSYSIKDTPYMNDYAVYKLSFWTRADQQWVDEGGNMYLYWGTNNSPNMYVYGDVQFKDTTEWGYNEFILVTNGRNRLAGNTFYFATDKTTKGSGNLYFDDVKLECIATDNFVSTSQDSTSQELSLDGTTWSRYLLNVEPGTTVLVKNWQYSGYVMSTAVKYVDRNGNATKVLNKKVEGYTKENFGTGDGRIFEFAMPDTSVRVISSFTKSANYNLSTAGASLRYDGDGDFDGIRFLTRLNLKADSIALKNGELTLKFSYDDGNGAKDYEVVELGSYLKRYSETTTGDGEEAVTTEDKLTVENAKWKSVAYKKGETEMKLLDYTSQYVDFTSVMLKGESVAPEDFNARKYTARGYMVIEDADGNQITILAEDQASACVNEIAPLVG